MLLLWVIKDAYTDKTGSTSQNKYPLMCFGLPEPAVIAAFIMYMKSMADVFRSIEKTEEGRYTPYSSKTMISLCKIFLD